MKFVNKLSVIGLVVLMFSFMNVANANNSCAGRPVASCDENVIPGRSADENARACNNSYVKGSSKTTNQCRWTEIPVFNPNNPKQLFKWTCNNSGSKCEY